MPLNEIGPQPTAASLETLRPPTALLYFFRIIRMPKISVFLLAVLALTACGDDEPCPMGEVRIGDTCLPTVDAGMDVTIAETCNGLDDDLDGVTDEADPMLGETCGNEVGVCTVGVTVCTEGELVCDGVQASDETCNGLDDDCDGDIDEDSLQDFYLDQDGDGYGSGDACTGCGPDECGGGTWVTMDGDCDETCDTCFTGATEVCDGLDNDCDMDVDNGVQTLLFEDTDADGYGVGLGVAGCLDEEGNAPAGFATEDGDCGPDDERAFPGAVSYATPIVGVDPTSFDFNCDGEEAFAHSRCDQSGSELEPVCGTTPGFCWFRLSGSSFCGDEAVALRAVSGTVAIPGLSDGVCRFTDDEAEPYTMECR